MHPGCLPSSSYDFGLAEDGVNLVDNCHLDFSGRDAADQTRSGATLQYRLADIVAVELAAFPGVDLSRFRAAPNTRLGHFPFEADQAFPTQR